MFAKEILRTAEEKSSKLNSDESIKSITVAISPLSHVKPESLLEAYKTISQGTGYADISINILPLLLNMTCSSCGKDFNIDKPTFLCPSCNCPSIEMVDNKEFSIISIDIKNK